VKPLRQGEGDLKGGSTRQGAALSLGLVDNKVAAIDDTWSGLRLVVRKEQRDPWSDFLDSTEK